MNGLPLVETADGLMKHAAGDLVRVALDLIDPRSDQPRKHFEKKSLERLAASLKASGDARQAIQVRVVPDGKGGLRIELVAGERRLRAAKLAGLKALKSEIVEILEERRVHLHSAIENLNRVGLNYMEMAYLVRRTLKDFPEWSLAKVADELGVSESYLHYCRNFLRLHPDLQELMLIGELDHKIATELAKAPVNQQHKALEHLQDHEARETKRGKRVTKTGIAKDVRKVMEKARIEPRAGRRGKKPLSSDTLTLRSLFRQLDDLELILKEIGQMKDDKLIFSEMGLAGLKQKFKIAITALAAQLKRAESLKNAK